MAWLYSDLGLDCSSSIFHFYTVYSYFIYLHHLIDIIQTGLQAGFLTTPPVDGHRAKSIYPV